MRAAATTRSTPPSTRSFLAGLRGELHVHGGRNRVLALYDHDVLARVNNTTPLDSGSGAATSAGGFSKTYAATALTTSNASEEIVYAWFGDAQSITTAPSGYTAQVAGSTTNIDGGHYGLYTISQASAGTTGTVTSVDVWIQ